MVRARSDAEQLNGADPRAGRLPRNRRAGLRATFDGAFRRRSRFSLSDCARFLAAIPQ